MASSPPTCKKLPPRDAADTRQAQERAEYAADMRGEEMEQHISERGSFGRLEVRLAADIAEVLGEALRIAREERGSRASQGIDHLDAGSYVARGARLQPREGTLPLGANTTPAGLFLDRALKLGLEQDAAAEIARAILAAPDRRLPDDKRTELVSQQMRTRGINPHEAERDIRWFERAARLLPNRLDIYGERQSGGKKSE